jgi:amino acid transporter
MTPEPNTDAPVDLDAYLATANEPGLEGVERLKPNVLRLRDAIFQNMTNMAPAAAMAYDFPVQAAVTAAGAAIALSNGISFIAVLLIVSSIIQFARKLPSAGGYFTFVSRGLGRRLGALSGLVFFLYAAVLPAEVTLIWAGITEEIVYQYLGLRVSWIFWEALMVVAVTSLAYAGVRRAARIGIIAGSIEIIVFVALGVSLLADPVTPPSFELLLPSSSPAGWSGILGFGLVYGILGFVGFEAAAPLAEETRQPRRNIPRAAFSSVAIMGTIYVFVSYAVVCGWGVDDLQSFTTSQSPFTTLASRVWGPAWILIWVAMTNSSFACALASSNASSRVMYSMGRVGLLPRFLGFVHARNRTPAHAIVVQGCITMALALLVGLPWGTQRGFAVLAVTLTIGAMMIYVLGNIALPVFYLKEHRSEFSWLLHLVIPAAATALLVYCLYLVVWPVPVYPLNLPAYIAAGWLIVSAAAVTWLARSRPEAMAKAGLLIVD